MYKNKNQPTTHQPMADYKDGTPFADIDIVDPPTKKRNGGRTPFDPDEFETRELTVGMGVPLFFQVMSLPFNMNVFLRERDVGRTTAKSKVRPIWSLMRFIELLYPDVGGTCTTDIECLKHLIGSHYVNEANFLAMCESLQHLLTRLRRPHIVGGVEIDQPGAHAQKITEFRAVFAKKPFWTPALDIEIKKVFGIVPDHLAKIKKITAARVETNLKNVKQIDYQAFKKFILAVEVRRLDAERLLRDDDDLTVNKRKKLKRTIIICACIIVQTMTARRIIEVLRISRFVPSKRDGYIIIIGLAKTRSIAVDSTVHAIDAAADDDEDEDALPDTTKTIDIPIMMLDWAGTPFTRDFLIEQVARIRELMAELVPDIATRTNTQVTNLIVGPMGTFTSRVWDVHTHSLLKGIISHAFRKFSASLSFYLCGEGRAAPSWYMYVLAHANIFVSLNYMNIVLYNFPSQHNDERDRKYNDLLAKHDRDMIQIRREIDLKQDRKRRRDDDIELPDTDDDELPVPRALSSDDDIDEMDREHDDDAAAEPVIARPTVSVPRIGGGMIDVPVYIKRPRRRLTGHERVYYEYDIIIELKRGAWSEIDMTKMVWRHFKEMGMTQKLWKKFRLL